MRDDFTRRTIETLAKRANQCCSNPACKRPTSGPHSDPEKSINIGVAAHISAASPGGRRYNEHLSAEQRKNINNGIWLCQSCSKLIDTDEKRFPEQLLHLWKKAHEESVFKTIYSPNSSVCEFAENNCITEIIIVPSSARDSTLLLIKASNIGVSDLVLTSIFFKVIEFRYVMPFGRATASSIGEIDLGKMTKYGESGSIPLYRVVKPGDTDEFSVVLSAGSLDGLFSSWNLSIALRANQNRIEVCDKEIHIPASKSGVEESFEEFKSKFAKLYRSNNKGMNWFQRLSIFRRHWLSKGFTFSYMRRCLYYSGPTNFMKER